MRNLHLATILLVGLAVSACFPTSNTPLGTSAKQTMDKELVGTWIGEKDENGTKVRMYFHFLPEKDETKGENAMTAVTVEPSFGDSKGDWDAYAVTTVRVGKHRYLNAVTTDDVGKRVPTTGFILVRYTINKKGLQLYLLDQEKVIAAVEAGRIAGTVSESEGMLKLHEVTLTADGAALDAFFATDEGASLFANDLIKPLHKAPL